MSTPPSAPSQFPSWEGSGVGSWRHFATQFAWRHPMNRSAELQLRQDQRMGKSERAPNWSSALQAFGN